MHRCRGIQRPCSSRKASRCVALRRGSAQAETECLTVTAVQVPDTFYSKSVPLSLLVFCMSLFQKAGKRFQVLFSCVEVIGTCDYARMLHSIRANPFRMTKQRGGCDPLYLLRVLKRQERTRCVRRMFSTHSTPEQKLRSSCSWLRRHCTSSDLVTPLTASVLQAWRDNDSLTLQKCSGDVNRTFRGETLDAAHLLQGLSFQQHEAKLLCFCECARFNFETTGWLADSLLASYLATPRFHPTPMLMKCITQITCTNVGKLSVSTVELLLSTTLSWDWHESEFECRATTLVHVLNLCEKVLDVCVLREQLKKFGYEFEQLAYLSRSHNNVCELRRGCAAVTKGFGNRVVAFLERHTKEVNEVQVSALADKMNPTLRRYFIDLLLMSQMRSAREEGEHDFFPGYIREDYMSPLELASHIHFHLRAGNCRTASLLLPFCTTRDQIVAVMRHTHGAGRVLSLKALAVLFDKNLTDKAYMSIRWKPPNRKKDLKSYTLLFEVEKRPLLPQEEDTDDNVDDLYALGELHDVQHVVPPDGLLLDQRHIQEWNASIRTRAVSALIENEQIREAVNVLRKCASHSVLPEMKTLLLLLEKTQSNENQLKECISLLKEEYKAVSPAVCRAFVERLTHRLQPHKGGHSITPLSRTDSLRLIGSLSLLGSLYFPAQCLSFIGEQAPTSLVKTVLQMSLSSEQSQCRPAPLHIDVIEKLLEASETIGLEVEFDVILPPSAQSPKCWWQSHEACSQSSIVSRLYHTECTGLWFVANDFLGCGARLGHFDVQRAISLIMLGCEDGPAILRIVKQQEANLLRKSMLATSHRQLRDLSLARTIGSVAECLTAKGYWTCALQLIPSSDSVPQILRLARLRALRHSPEFGELAVIALKEEEDSLCREGARQKPVSVFRHFHFPPRLEKMITNSGVGHSFFKGT